MKSRGWNFALATAGLIASCSLLFKSRSFSFKGRSVLISGGSRGLGLELARLFVAERAKVALLARDADELERSRDFLAPDASLLTLACDVSSTSDVSSAVKVAVEEFGGLDVLVNCAGIIQVGPAGSMQREDFQRALETHFWGPLNLIAASLPYLKSVPQARIVNICSIGGKISVPHLLPYCVSKFALAGFSEGLRSELIKEDIKVTTVYPGLMRTGSHINALFRGKHRSEYAWFSIAAGAPIISQNSVVAAEQIMTACKRGKAILVFPLPARMAQIQNALFPNFGASLLQLANRILPEAPSFKTPLKKGADCSSWISPSLLTLLGDRAISRNNESAPLKE